MKKLLLSAIALLVLATSLCPLEALASMQDAPQTDPVTFYDPVIKMRFNVVDEDAATVAVAKRIQGDVSFLENIYYEGDITLPNKVEYKEKEYRVVALADSAFYNCSDLTSITFNKDLERIGASAFSYCEKLDDEIAIGGKITSIGYLAFHNCIKLVNITIGKQVTTIEEAAFAKTVCPIILNPENPNFIQTGFILFQPRDGRLIYADPQITTLEMPANVTRIGDYALSNCKNLESVVMHEGLKEIGSHAFNACYKLTEIDVPASMELIEQAAFKYTIGITAFNVKDGNTHYKVVDKALVSADGKELIAYPIASAGQKYVVPEGVEVIGEGAFATAPFEEVVFPESLKEVAGSAFHQCDKLLEANLPDATETLGTQAFALNSALRKIHVGPKLKYIGKYCFFMSPARDLYFNCATPPYIPPTFMGCFTSESEKEGTLYVPKGSKEAYKSNIEFESFVNIVEHDFTQAPQLAKATPYQLAVAPGELTINAAASLVFTLYTLEGTRVWQGVVSGTETITLPQGTYILSCERGARKIVMQ